MTDFQTAITHARQDVDAGHIYYWREGRDSRGAYVVACSDQGEFTYWREGQDDEPDETTGDPYMGDL